MLVQVYEKKVGKGTMLVLGIAMDALAALVAGHLMITDVTGLGLGVTKIAVLTGPTDAAMAAFLEDVYGDGVADGDDA